MALSPATLSTQLQGISGATLAAAKSAWSAAWAAYFAGAVAGSGPGVAFTTNGATIAAARAAMETAMGALATTDQGDDAAQAGIIAWWDYLVANPGACFSGASSITKPSGLTSIAAALPAIFATNTSTAASAAVACAAVAASIHGNNAGGSANIGGAQTIA